MSKHDWNAYRDRQYREGVIAGFTKNATVDQKVAEIATALLVGGAEIATVRKVAEENRKRLRRSNGRKGQGAQVNENTHKAGGKRSGSHGVRARAAVASFIAQADMMHRIMEAKRSKSARGFRFWCERNNVDHAAFM